MQPAKGIKGAFGMPPFLYALNHKPLPAFFQALMCLAGVHSAKLVIAKTLFLVYHFRRILRNGRHPAGMPVKHQQIGE
jgi:hypothetical protein